MGRYAQTVYIESLSQIDIRKPGTINGGQPPYFLQTQHKEVFSVREAFPALELELSEDAVCATATEPEAM